MYWAIFGMVISNQTNEQPGDPSASLLLTSEKAVFCCKSLETLLYKVFLEEDEMSSGEDSAPTAKRIFLFNFEAPDQLYEAISLPANIS